MLPMDFPVYADYAEADYDGNEHNQDQEYYDEYSGTEASSLSDLSFVELWDACVRSVSVDAFSNIGFILVGCLVPLIIRALIPYRVPFRNATINIVIALTGSFILFRVFENTCIFLIVVGLVGYIVLKLADSVGKLSRFRGTLVATISAVYVITFESVADPTVVHRIRGAQMILLMKIISLAFHDAFSLVSLLEYLGYVLCVGNVIFGPWISLTDYRECILDPDVFRRREAIRWTLHFFRSLCLSVACLSVSTCFIAWVLPDNLHKWISAYQSALSFRFSHYFVCFFSEATLLAMGTSHVSVAKPWKIELPRSLVEVVTYWNIPMRNWLRNYVFFSARKVLNVPCTLLLTYGASALLHGVNFQLAAVLLSLAVFSYVEHELRKKIARIFDACVEAKRCKDCSHQHKPNETPVKVANFSFGVLAMFHLAYLGVMFDSSKNQEQGYGYLHTLSKWSHLDYAGHYVAALCFVIQLLL